MYKGRVCVGLNTCFLQGGLLVATKELFLKNRCCNSVQLTLPAVSCNCVSLENIRSLEQRSFSLHLHRYRKIVSYESLWVHSRRPTFRICVCKYPGKQLLIPVKLTFTPCIDHFVHLSTPIFSSLSLFLRISGPAVLLFWSESSH